MENSDTEETTKVLDKEYKILAKNTIYSIFNNYGVYLFSLVTSFFIARMISIEEWGIYILAYSIVGLFIISVNFSFPGLIYATNFYVPRYRAKNQINKLKSFILKAIYLRILVTISVFIVSIIVFNVFGLLFSGFLENHLDLLYILSPMIIIFCIDTFLVSILTSMNMFLFGLLLQILNLSLYLVPIMLLYFFSNTLLIEHLAVFNVISLLIPFIFSICMFSIKFSKLKSTEEPKMKTGRVFKKVFKYGSTFSFFQVLADYWKETQTQAIGIFEDPLWVTGYKIATNYTRVSVLFQASLNSPLIYSMSSIDYKTKYDQLVTLFTGILIYSSFILLLSSGILIFFSDFFLSFIYGTNYLIYLSIINILLLSSIFATLPNLISLFLRAINRIKIGQILYLVIFILQICFFFIGITNFGIFGVVYFSLLLNIVALIIYTFLYLKFIKIKKPLKKFYLLYLVFFCSYSITILLGVFFLDEINNGIWAILNLPIFMNLHILKIFVFTIIFLTLIILFKIFSKKDLENMESLFTKDKFLHKNIRRFIQFLKRFVK